MAKLAYYASRIAPDKPHQLETPEGYRIYTAVPICRTGFQEYLGRELKDHPDYDPAWSLDDDAVVKVFRPKEVVTAPETVASFEGKSVTDGHPPEDVALVMVENDAEYGRGHMQNLRVGSPIEEGEAAAETPLVADLFVKSQPLNDKIDGGVREVSCGYVYNLKRLEDGTLVMTRICGNHVAVVPKGRAGAEVAIRDAATVTHEVRKHPEKEKFMKKENFWGRILKRLAATDAAPEELEEVAKRAQDEGEATTQQAELHPELKQHIGDTKTALDAMKATCDAIFEHLGVGKKKEGADEEQVIDPATDDANVLEMTTEEQGKTELPKQIAAADSAEALTVLRPKVVAAKDAAITKAFNIRVREVKKAAAAQDSVYADLAGTASSVQDQQDDVDPSSFFNGVSHSEGLRRYNDHLANKAKKGGK
jgi:hypothetical protein